MDEYPPEYDGPDNCLVCQKDISSSASECECPECPVCTEVGDPDCYANGHMEKGNRAFNLRDLADHLGAHNVDGIAKRLFKDTGCIFCELYEEFHCSRCGAEVGYEESCDECDKAFRREEK